MDLQELKFVVITDDLDKAAKKIEALGTAVSKINKPITQAAIDTEKLAQAQAKTAAAAAKVEEAEAKAAIAKDKVAKAQEKVNNSLSAGNAIAERQAEILRFQTEGYSKGQAATLASAKAAGALDSVLEKLGVTLKDQRILMGGQPFDNSIGLMQKLENETRSSTEVNNLFNRSLGLTEKQMIDLAREHERLTKKYELEGKSLNGLTAEYEQIVAQSVKLNQINDARTKAIRDQVKEQNAAVKASQYLADADARLAAALDTTNVKLDKQASDALVKYEKALRQSGKSAEEVAAKLAVAKTQFESIADKKQADKLQYLARAISVQMGDVGISLASGMNPLLVMIQQGDQIRGAIQQAGASGKELEKAMSNAAVQIATSFAQTGQAVGGFFVNAIKSAGQAIFGLPIELARASFTSLAGSADTAAVAFERLKIAAMAFGKTGIMLIITSLVVLAKTMYDSLQTQRELSVALATTGSGMRMNRAEALDYADALSKSGKSASEYTGAIIEMAKAGFKAGANFKLIADSAIDMQKYAGQPIKDTIKAFQELTEKPVEGIAKLVKESKNVSAESIKLINDLARQGKMTEAAAIATKEMVKANSDAVKQIIADAGYLERAWIATIDTISEYWKKFKDSVLGWGTQDALSAQLKEAQNKLSTFKEGDNRPLVAADKKRTEELISGLQEQIRLQGKLKTVEDERNKQAKAAVGFEELKTKYKIPEDETKKILTNIEELGKKAGRTAEEINKVKAAYLATLPKGPAVSVAPSKDLSIIQKDYNEQLKLAEGFAKDERSILKARFDAGLIDRGEYVSKDVELLQQSEQKQLDVIDSFTNQYAQAFGKQAVLLSEAFGKAKDADNRKKLLEDITNLGKDAKEFFSTVEDKKSALASAFNARELQTLLNYQKAIKDNNDAYKTLSSTQADYIENKKIETDLQDRLVNVYGAEAASIKAAAEEQKRWTIEITKFNKARDDAFKEYKTIQADPNSQGTEALRLSAEKYISAMGNADKVVADSRLAITQAGIDAEIAYYKQEYERASSTVTDAIVTALFEGGKAGSKKIRDYIIAELKKPITIVVKALVDATLGSFIQSAVGGSASAAIGGSALGTAAGNAITGFQIGSSTLGEITGAFGKGLISGGAPEALGTTAFATEAGSTAASAYGAGASTSQMAIAAGPYVLAAVAALNALGAFKSTKTVGGGISGTLGTGNLESYALTRTSGSLFSGPSYNAKSQGVTEATKALDDAFIAMRSAVTDTADSLGFSTDKIKTFTMAVGDIKIHPDIAQLGLVLDGLSDEQKIAKINEVLTKSGNAMAELILGAGTTLEKLKSTFDFFYQNFYTESEKFDNLTKSLTDSFAKLNLPIPKTREQFKQLVIAAQKAGDTALLKGLTDLQYAFAELVPAAETAVKSVEALADSLKSMYQKFIELTGTTAEIDAYNRSQTLENTAPATRAIQAYLFALEDVKTTSEDVTKAQDELEKAETNLKNARADALKGLIDTTKNFIDSLRKFSQSLLLGNLSPLTPEQKYPEARKQFESLLKIATSSATTPEEIRIRDNALSELESAASSFLEASRVYNASSSKYTQDVEFIQQAFLQTADLLDSQVSDAEKQLKSLGSIDSGISAVEKAIRDLKDAQDVANNAQIAFNKALEASLGLRPAATQAYSSANAVVNKQASFENGMIYGKNGSSLSSSEALGFVNNYVSNINAGAEGFTAKDLYNKLTEWGVSSDLLASLTGYSKSAILQWFQGLDSSIPAFAQGTNYVPSDMYAKIHKGERIVPAADNDRLMQSLNNRNETNAILVTEIKNLRQEIVELRNQQSKETATIVISNIDAQQKNAEHVGEVISKTSQESNWNAKVRETVKLK